MLFIRVIEWLIILNIMLIYFHIYWLFLSGRKLRHICIFVFLEPHPPHMEIPRLGFESELKLPAYTTATAMPDLSHVCNLHHSSWQHWILDPLREAGDQTCNLMVPSQICFCCTTMGIAKSIFKNYSLTTGPGGDKMDRQIHLSWDLTFTTYLQYTRSRVKTLAITRVTIFVLTTTLYNRYYYLLHLAYKGNWGTGKLNDLPKVTQRIRIWIEAAWFQSSCPTWQPQIKSHWRVTGKSQGQLTGEDHSKHLKPSARDWLGTRLGIQNWGLRIQYFVEAILTLGIFWHWCLIHSNKKKSIQFSSFKKPSSTLCRGNSV